MKFIKKRAPVRGVGYKKGCPKKPVRVSGSLYAPPPNKRGELTKSSCT